MQLICIIFFSNQYIQLSQVPILYFYNISTYLSCSCSLLVYVARKVRLGNKKYFASFNDTFFSDSGSFNIYIYIYIYIYIIYIYIYIYILVVSFFVEVYITNFSHACLPSLYSNTDVISSLIYI